MWYGSLMEKSKGHHRNIKSVEAMHAFASDFSKNLCGGRVLCLHGDLGAGKTTFTQGLLSKLGAIGPYVSPTFLVMKQYDLDIGTLACEQGIERIYHIDAYRITSEDMIELGWEEISHDAKALLIIEWPQNIDAVLSGYSDLQTVYFEYADEGVRTVKF